MVGCVHCNSIVTGKKIVTFTQDTSEILMIAAKQSKLNKSQSSSIVQQQQANESQSR